MNQKARAREKPPLTKLFGTSGIRGKTSTTMTPQLALQTGQALAAYTRAKAILTAYDTRTTSPLLHSALTSGITACGATALNQGIIPTPVLAYLTRLTQTQVGVMITASHNSPEYNGIKPYNPDTTAYNQAQQNHVERLIALRRFRLANWQKIGKATQINEAHRYIEMITSTVKLRKPWKIILDPGNGATSQLAPQILRELGCKVTTMNSQPDGYFPGRGADPNEKTLRSLRSMVRNLGADVGIAYDGDGDRMIPIDERGQVTPQDQTFAAYAAHKIRHQKSKTVVTHVEASICVDEMVEKEGGKVVRTKVGDVSIAEAIKKQEATFGGEPCGAWIHPSYHYCPDGILSSVLFLQTLEEANQKPSQFVSKAPTYTMLRQNIACPDRSMSKVMKKAYRILSENFRETKEQSIVDGVRLTFNEGWLLVRPSGTEPLMRITVEARTRKRAESTMRKAIRLVDQLVKEASR